MKLSPRFLLVFVGLFASALGLGYWLASTPQSTTTTSQTIPQTVRPSSAVPPLDPAWTANARPTERTGLRANDSKQSSKWSWNAHFTGFRSTKTCRN
jgi:hypothetical protein